MINRSNLRNNKSYKNVSARNPQNIGSPNNKLNRSRSKSPVRNGLNKSINNNSSLVKKQLHQQQSQRSRGAAKGNIGSNAKINRSRSKSPSPQRPITQLRGLKNKQGGQVNGQKGQGKLLQSQKRIQLNKSLSHNKIQQEPTIKNKSILNYNEKLPNIPSPGRKNHPKSVADRKPSSNYSNYQPPQKPSSNILINSSFRKGRTSSSPSPVLPRLPQPSTSRKHQQQNYRRFRSDQQALQKLQPSSLASSIQLTIKSQQRQMGIVFYKPQHDKILFKPLQVTDEVYEKYYDLISNDNDSTYVVNALPQLLSSKKQDDSGGRAFVSGKISRLSGVFENISVEKIITASKKLPQYYTGQLGKNLTPYKIVLQTKHKVQVDLGFLLFSLDADKLTIFRIYISRIYRKMNYLGFVYTEMLKYLMSKYPGYDKWSMFILQRNVAVHKFFKFMGFKIEKIFTESRNKTVDYFQEFTMKKKDLSTVISSIN